jgi:branched-chain amino acid aminotransferase
MDLPQTRTELKKIVEETVSRNDGDLLLEIIYSGGKANASGVAPAGSADLYIAVFPLKLPPERWYQGGVKLASYPYQRQWPEVKLLNYVGAVIAHQTVVKKFKANEALFLSPDKRQIVLEGTTFNFFIVCGNTVITHPLDGKILAGITRKIVLKLAKKIKGLKVKEGYFSYQNLPQANEAFLTSSTRNVVPVTKIDNIMIGKGKPGKVTQQLGEMFAEYLERYQA